MSRTPTSSFELPRKPFIVAEVSGEHGGDFQRALALVHAAADAGADAVKFQCYRAEDMVIDRDYVLEDGPWKGRNLYLLYHEAQTPPEWFRPLFCAAKSRGLVAFTSVYDAGGIAFMERLGVDCPMYKIASFEAHDVQLIKAAAKTGKQLVISTGMAVESEVLRAWQLCTMYGRPPILLHCVSAYPATAEDLRMGNLIEMHKRWNVWTGLSDHTRGSEAAMHATQLGASMIEKHLTLDRDGGTPDAAFAATPEELAELVAQVRFAEPSVFAEHYPVEYGVRPNEVPSLRLRRSLWTTRSLHAGEDFSDYNVGSFRPNLGLHPLYYHQVTRAVASRDLPAGAPLDWDMIHRLNVNSR